MSEITSSSYSVVAKYNYANSSCTYLVQHITLNKYYHALQHLKFEYYNTVPSNYSTDCKLALMHHYFNYLFIVVCLSFQGSVLSSVMSTITLVPTTISPLPSQVITANRGLLIGSITTIVLILLLISVGIAAIFIYIVKKMKRKSTLEIEK